MCCDPKILTTNRTLTRIHFARSIRSIWEAGRCWRTLLAMAALAIGMPEQRPMRAEDTKPARGGKDATESRPKKDAGGASSQAPAAPTQKKTETAKTTETEKKTETAVFAGGCFWCTEFAFEQLAGVVDVESGYSGGTKSTANYEAIHLGHDGARGSDSRNLRSGKVTYDKLLDVFFDSHDPTQLNRQGEDEGRQYRSAIFFADDEQQQQAKAKIADLEAKHVYKRRIATKLERLKKFYPAEAYHQKRSRRNPFSPYIQNHAVPKAAQVRSKHPGLIRKGE